MNGAVDYTGLRSVMAQGHSTTVSNKFAFIPTTRVIDILIAHGWVPAKATEKSCRVEEKRGFQEHMIRFRRPEDVERVNSLITRRNHVVSRANALAEFPEIVLVNAHDGGKSFSIMAGMFRLICENGLIVANGTFETHRIKHSGFQDQNVIAAVYHVVENTPKIEAKVGEFKQIELNRPEQEAFAHAAMVAKYGEDDKVVMNADLRRAVLPFRTEDRIDPRMDTNTLWNTFNIMQEKLVEKGGRFVRDLDVRGGVKRARGIKSVSENVRVNQALWALAEKMAELKGATV